MPNIRVSRKSGFIMRNGVSRRETLWLGIGSGANSIAASATAVLINSLNAAAMALRPFTIVRTVGTWLVHSDQSAATEAYFGNIGAAVVSDQAEAIGVSAVPTPATDLGSDLWFMHQTWIGRFQLVGSAIQTEVVSKNYESRAMRKVEDGQDLVFVIEAGLGENGLTLSHVGRVLIKLH